MQGLGKTIELLACVMAHRYKSHGIMAYPCMQGLGKTVELLACVTANRFKGPRLPPSLVSGHYLLQNQDLCPDSAET